MTTDSPDRLAIAATILAFSILTVGYLTATLVTPDKPDLRIQREAKAGIPPAGDSLPLFPGRN